MSNATMSITNHLPCGSHICLLFNSEQERRRLVSNFVNEGLNGGHKFLYLTDTMQPGEVSGWLTEQGIKVPSEEQSNQFNVHKAEHVYCPSGEFVVNDIIGALGDFYQQADSEGYAGFYGTGEMSWARKGILGAEQFLRYEARLNCLDHPLTALCQYDVNLFDGETLLNVLRVHPWILVNGQIVRNPHYMEPSDFLAQLDAVHANNREHCHR